MSLFGASTTQNKPSLFGSLTANTSQPQPNNSSLFGGFGNTQQQNNGTQQQATLSLFGQTQQNQQHPSPAFGNLTQQPQQQANSLFGASTQQPTTSLFGAPAQQPQQQQQTSGSLFGAPAAQPFGAASSFGVSQQPAQQQLQLGQSLSQSTRAPLWQAGSGVYPREKTIPEQMQTLLEKWSPDSHSCVFQHYFYNNVPPEAVPYYVPAPGENEQKWEDALAKKPSEGSIPVLCKGFAALGNRLRIQVQSASALQARLHEINNSLTAILQEHDLNISVRAMDARRRHLALSQRCLQLATKVQILRNRGYALDSTEEDLKKKLVDLERTAFDPQLSGRQEEIWARLVGIRERARFLQEETEKAGMAAQDGEGGGIDEEISRKTTKILGDYDLQISHLQKEVEIIRKDFDA